MESKSFAQSVAALRDVTGGVLDHAHDDLQRNSRGEARHDRIRDEAHQ
jgi:hypothetical protein